MLLKHHLFLSILSLLFIMLTSCKNTEDTPQPATQTQNLSLKMSTVIGNKPIDFTSVFTTEAGARYTLSSFRYYVSNIRLVKQDGSEYPITGKYLLVNPATEDYDLGQVPVGDYKGLKFAVGIDSVTNHADPTVYPTNNPLAIQSPGMHWSWSSGYIFLMMEGSCDTTNTNTDVQTFGQFSHPLFYHIGMDMLYREVNLDNVSFAVNANDKKTLHVQTYLNNFFTGIDIKTENASHTMGSVPLATKLANNIQTMFSVIQ
ncbi:MbnP family protein [Sporocytophaga myxococcoides]|uniref:MbnP family protein n=1 Tax=Sporocytophaga myxococcoides TaxID=153721 RepID=UPI0012DE6267|nr:MbnP family protein [Sporocytophaga myxococcoides]